MVCFSSFLAHIHVPLCFSTLFHQSFVYSLFLCSPLSIVVTYHCLYLLYIVHVLGRAAIISSNPPSTLSSNLGNFHTTSLVLPKWGTGNLWVCSIHAEAKPFHPNMTCSAPKVPMTCFPTVQFIFHGTLQN